MISAWWLLLLIPAVFVGYLIGWAMVYIANALRLGATIVQSIVSAAKTMKQDADVIAEF